MDTFIIKYLIDKVNSGDMSNEEADKFAYRVEKDLTEHLLHSNSIFGM